MGDVNISGWLPFVPQGSHTQNSSMSSAVSLTVPAGATVMMLQVQTQNVRFTLDGTAPTTTKGFQLKAGDPAVILPVYGGQVIRVIEETTTGVLDYQYGHE